VTTYINDNTSFEEYMYYIGTVLIATRSWDNVEEWDRAHMGLSLSVEMSP
jgi:hypothetical protein